MRLPWHWKIEQQITTIDGATFPMYFTNMRSLLAEMVRKSEMIIFNRCDGIEELNVYKRNIKAVNPNADVIFEDANGEIDTIFEEDLPFDLNAPVIELDNTGYGIWYLDSLDHLERYIGKTIKFKAMVLIPEGFQKNYFVPGRMAMTCCADDIQFIGPYVVAKGVELPDYTWVRIKSKINYEEDRDGRKVIILTCEELTKINPIKDPVLNLV